MIAFLLANPRIIGAIAIAIIGSYLAWYINGVFNDAAAAKRLRESIANYNELADKAQLIGGATDKKAQDYISSVRKIDRLNHENSSDIGRFTDNGVQRISERIATSQAARERIN